VCVRYIILWLDIYLSSIFFIFPQEEIFSNSFQFLELFVAPPLLMVSLQNKIPRLVSPKEPFRLETTELPSAEGRKGLHPFLAMNF